ncbi:hypothetical protein Tco_0782069, partial [Tanacetum coccineum]
MKGICITIHHEGTFTYDPLSYEYGDVEVVENVDLGNTSYERLLEICKECCLFPVHLELYVEHHGYDVMAEGVIEEVVDEELDDEIEMEDISEYVKEGFSYPVHNLNLPWNEMAPLLGMKFEHPHQLKDCLINYGVANGYQLWYRRNDYRNISVMCGKNVKEGRNFNLGSLVTYKWIAKQIAEEVIKNHKINYTQMDYRDEILSTNPGSSVQLDVDTMNDGKLSSKGSMKERWTSCRRVIGLDSCFLKSIYRGELLTAMGRDANNQMFLMAWAVVSIENSENWLWFLSNLGKDFNLAMGAYLTILSDGHKGLIKAVKELLPHAEHRLSSTLEDPKTWCRAYFQKDRSCAAFENGISESYHSAIGSARTKHVITMLEEVRVYLMQRLFAMNQKAVNLNDIICPSIRKELEKLKQYQRYWLVYPCGQQLFEVRKADEGFGVAAYCMLNQDPGIGVSSWYNKQMWVDAYSHFIKPVGGSSLWVNSDNPPPLPPQEEDYAKPKPQQEKRKPGRKSQQTANQPFNPPNADPSVDPNADLSFANSSFFDSSFADPSVANPSFADPSVTPIFRQ